MTVLTPRRRGRFQVHLSTAILLMFAAGGLVSANMLGMPTYPADHNPPDRSHLDYGWPWTAFTYTPEPSTYSRAHYFLHGVHFKYSPCITYPVFHLVCF